MGLSGSFFSFHSPVAADFEETNDTAHCMEMDSLYKPALTIPRNEQSAGTSEGPSAFYIKLIGKSLQSYILLLHVTCALTLFCITQGLSSIFYTPIHGAKLFKSSKELASQLAFQPNASYSSVFR